MAIKVSLSNLNIDRRSIETVSRGYVGSDPTDLLCSAIKTNSLFRHSQFSFQMDLGLSSPFPSVRRRKKNVGPSFSFSVSLAGLPSTYPEWSG